MKTKVCSGCKVEKPLSEFPKNKREKDGFHHYCKMCNNQRVNKWYHQNRDSQIRIRKQWRTNHPDKQREYALNSIFGSGAAELYNKLFQQQKGHCAICGIHQSNLNGRLGLDHNHTTHQNRGLLCDNCNLGIGQLKDSSELVYQAYLYLQHYEIAKEQ